MLTILWNQGFIIPPGTGGGGVFGGEDDGAITKPRKKETDREWNIRNRLRRAAIDDIEVTELSAIFTRIL